MFRNRCRQNGSLYIVVIFVLVVMGFLATTLSRIQWSDADSQTRDVLGTQAWLLAQSVNEEALSVLYPLQSQSSGIGANCATLSINALVDSENQFINVGHCKLIELSCTPSGSLAQVDYFKLISRVSCGAENSVFEVERAEEIWIKE